MNSPIDAQGTGAIPAALGWIESAMLGTIATAIAVVAVAAIGLLMLAGRIDSRRAARVILGCFVLFGASSIAAGIMHSIGRGEVAAGQLAPPPPVYPSNSPAAPNTDPYAGAAVPPRR